MKNFLLLLLLAFPAINVHSEDVLQVAPFEVKVGAVSADRAYFSIMMNNSSAEIWAVQFDVLLPEGMEIVRVMPNQERFPNTYDDWDERYVYDHKIEYNEVSTGGTRIVAYTTKERRIKGNSGEIMKVYYTSSEDMEPGIYPIKVKGADLTITGSSSIKPVESSSYCFVGESPLKTEQSVDMSSLTGYVPSFTIEAMNSQMAENSKLTLLDLSSADSLGAVPVMGNKNGLVRVSATAATSTLADAKSVVVATADGDVCNSLSLADGDWNFNASEGFTAKNAAFNRVFKAGQWSTVCLPYGVSAEQLSVIKENGTEVERLASYDADANILKFEAVTEMVANTPYIIKCSKECAPFEALADVAVAASATLNDVHCGIVTMSGVLSTTILNSDASVSYYGYNSADGSFVKIGSNGTAYPFRAFISIPSAGAEVKRIGVEHGNGELTGITEVDDMNTMSVTDVYTVDGKLVRSAVSVGKATKGLASGVYVVGSKKIVVR